MDEDMGGKLQDLEKKGEGDEEDDDDKEDEPDKEMGETDKGDDVLDKEVCCNRHQFSRLLKGFYA